MKINLFQSGGGLPPFTYYRPVLINNALMSMYGSMQGDSSSSKSSSDGDSSKKEVTDKDLLTALKDIKGLESDTEQLFNMLQDFYKYDNIPGLPNTRNLSSKYLLVMRYLQLALNEKEAYDNAYTQVKENHGLNEIAITDQGKVVCLTEEGILIVTPETFNKLRELGKARTLTNSQLLGLRAKNPNYAFDRDIINTISNGIGLDVVDKLIHLFMGKLGSDKESTEGITSDAVKASQGIEFLLNAANKGANLSGMTVEGLYKSKLLTENQARQAQHALNYIYKMLPENAKALLEVKGGSKEGALNIIQSFVVSQTDSTVDFSTNLLVDANGEKLGTNGKGKGGEGFQWDSTTTTTNAQRFLQGRGQVKQFVILDGTTDGIFVQATTLPVDNGGNLLGMGATVFEISLSDFGGMIDPLNVSMGGSMISEANLSKIMTDGNAYSIDLPIDVLAKAKGYIKPDMEMIKNKEKADEIIRLKNIPPTDYESINKIYKENNLPIKYNQDGSMNVEAWARFMAFNGTALSSAFSQDMTFSNLDEVLDDSEENGYINLYKSRNKISDKDWDFDKRSWWDRNSPILNGHDSFYKGTVFIAMNTNTFNAMASSKIKPDDNAQLEALEQQKVRLANFNKSTFSE